jgi:hypothetical protein
MRKNDVFKVKTEICQECMKIRDSSYMKKSYHEDFVFSILFYLFLNNYF